ncbi:anti-sigma factor [Achromobacter mucicolens]|uniref:anti-sigma factor n=1 Tax=Achromobacter mucicolens TaxID=1389922 RepID=UPI0024490506|nr:anti-sigma factor [Achromobacter mucicolens]MDH0092467.1 anti-sigma factor [Achromobacter mucicolens]
MSAPTVPPENLDELAGEYVLGTLSGARRQEVNARLPHDAALRAAVDRWEARLLPLTSLTEPIEPSPGLWPRIAKTLDRQHTARQAGQPTRPGWWDSLFFWRGAAASGLAAALVLAGTLALRPAQTPGPVQYMVVLVAPQSQTPGWVVQASAGQREVQLVPIAAMQVPADRALEFWTKADGWAGPVSLGLIKPGEPVRIALDKLPPLEANQLFELTLEPPNGSPTGKPTGPIQFIGRAVKVM